MAVQANIVNNPRVLGEGGFGVVSVVLHQGVQVAKKAFRIESGTDAGRHRKEKLARKELEISLLLRHKNIIHFIVCLNKLISYFS